MHTNQKTTTISNFNTDFIVSLTINTFMYYRGGEKNVYSPFDFVLRAMLSDWALLEICARYTNYAALVKIWAKNISWCRRSTLSKKSAGFRSSNFAYQNVPFSASVDTNDDFFEPPPAATWEPPPLLSTILISPTYLVLLSWGGLYIDFI